MGGPAVEELPVLPCSDWFLKWQVLMDVSVEFSHSRRLFCCVLYSWQKNLCLNLSQRHLDFLNDGFKCIVNILTFTSISWGWMRCKMCHVGIKGIVH